MEFIVENNARINPKDPADVALLIVVLGHALLLRYRFMMLSASPILASMMDSSL